MRSTNGRGAFPRLNRVRPPAGQPAERLVNGLVDAILFNLNGSESWRGGSSVERPSLGRSL